MDIKFDQDKLDLLKIQSRKETLAAFEDLGQKRGDIKQEILANQFPNTHTEFGIDENNELTRKEVEGNAPENTEFGSSEEMKQAFQAQEEGMAQAPNTENNIEK